MGRIQTALAEAQRRRQEERGPSESRTRAVTIELLDGDSTGFTRRFRQHSILIGRGGHNDVPFDPFDDPTVSAQHAEIRVEGDRVMLYDMGSLNGCYVGDERVRRLELSDRTVVRLGKQGPTIRIELGELEAAGDPVPPRAASGTSVGASLPTTAEVAIDGKKGRFSRLETLILCGLLIGVLVDILLGLAA